MLRVEVDGVKPFSNTRAKRIRAMVADFLTKSSNSGNSASGRSLAFAVEWCELNNKNYIILAHPGQGYYLQLTDERLECELSVLLRKYR